MIGSRRWWRLGSKRAGRSARQIVNSQSESSPSSKPIRNSEYLAALVIIAICTGVALLFRPYLAAANLVMIYLLGVTIVAARFHKRVALFTSILSVAVFDFFC